MNLRLESFEHGLGRLLLEHEHVINDLECCQDFRPLFGRDYRPRRALDRPYGRVTGDADHKHVAEPCGLFETADVADVEQVEAPVRPDNRAGIAPPPVA
jgi:hypothetical protein